MVVLTAVPPLLMQRLHPLLIVKPLLTMPLERIIFSIIVSSYSDSADLSGAKKTPDWSKIFVVRPAALGASLAEITTEAPVEESTTPAKPDESIARRKQLAVYVLFGVGGLCVVGLIVWLYQVNKYKIKKRLNNEQ